MNPARTISPRVWKLCAAILLAGALSVAGLFLQRRLELSRLEDRLVEEALALDSARFARPTHVAPALPGSFGERAAAHLEKLEAAQAQLGALTVIEERLLASVLRGAQPATAASPRLQATLAENRGALLGLLEATHAEAARPVASLAAPELDETAVATVSLAARLVALEIVDRVEAGQATEALGRCVDGLALARDLSYGSALQGRMLATAVTGRLLTPCARALDAAPAEAKREALHQLEAIRDATPGFAATLGEERTVMIVTAFGAGLSSETVERLPPRFRATAEGVAARTLAGHDHPEGSRFLIRASLPAIRGAWLALAAADSLGKTERAREWLGIRQRLAASGNPIVKVAAPVLDPTFFDARDRLARTQVELLIHAAALDLRRARSGRWPVTLAELGTEVGLNPRADAVREAPLVYFLAKAEETASLEGGEREIAHLSVTADEEVSP